MGEEKKSRFIKGGVKEFTTKGGKNGFNIDVQKDDFDTLPTNEKGFVKMTMWKRDEVGKFGDTHMIVLNDWKPNKENNTDDESPF